MTLTYLCFSSSCLSRLSEEALPVLIGDDQVVFRPVYNHLIDRSSRVIFAAMLFPERGLKNLAHHK